MLWCELRGVALGGLRFRRQQPIGRYIVDFFCPPAGLIVEVDGEQHAIGRQPQADVARTRWLEAQGHVVARFWTHEVMHELDSVCVGILAASRVAWCNPPWP